MSVAISRLDWIAVNEAQSDLDRLMALWKRIEAQGNTNGPAGEYLGHASGFGFFERKPTFVDITGDLTFYKDLRGDDDQMLFWLPGFGQARTVRYPENYGYSAQTVIVGDDNRERHVDQAALRGAVERFFAEHGV